jgi:hypothetical protein
MKIEANVPQVSEKDIALRPNLWDGVFILWGEHQSWYLL